MFQRIHTPCGCHSFLQNGTPELSYKDTHPENVLGCLIILNLDHIEGNAQGEAYLFSANDYQSNNDSDG